MEIDIVGPQCHLIAAWNINHIFNCKLLTFPHYCFLFFPSKCVCLGVYVCTHIVWCLKDWYRQWEKRSPTAIYELRTSLFYHFLFSCFLMWTDVNISNKTDLGLIYHDLNSINSKCWLHEPSVSFKVKLHSGFRYWNYCLTYLSLRANKLW